MCRGNTIQYFISLLSTFKRTCPHYNNLINVTSTVCNFFKIKNVVLNNIILGYYFKPMTVVVA